jgi:hypothetical protein
MAEKNHTTQHTLFDAGDRFRRCKQCGEIKPIAEYPKSESKRNGRKRQCRRGRCKQCQLQNLQQWVKDNPEQWKLAVRRNNFRNNFGITLEEYDEMVSRQDGLCAICGNPETVKHARSGIHRLSVDHDHATGQIRALLCKACNSGLGQFRDDPALLRKAADYLERFARR